MRIESKVQQLDDGVDSICVMLTGILVTQRQQADRLNRIDGRLRDIESRQSMNRIRVDHIEDLLTEIDANREAKSCMQPIVDQLRDAWEVTAEPDEP
jgi:hypothetical protein